jgi:competence protein ComEC
LPGDVGALIEARLMQGDTKLISDVLLVPHHGSASSSSAAFVAATAPTYALVSAGWRNRFGHPHAAVLERYRRQGASLISTAAKGAITVRFEANTVGPMLASQREQRRRLWHEAAESVP